ncbi:hypothetical protein RHS01_01955 [Rhizoctonia solani]|uniref:Uncharacterized protein n=1 Tax=Rhizoctonia solani TaxID=456999 RepID=A0A8H7M8R2_9AGAM|nr:hypothetical protein RHS01_01955 [Rhizoctonia solani]
MEISSEVLPLLGPGLTKRAGSSIPANPIQTLVEALEMLRLAKYFIVAVITFLVYDIGNSLHSSISATLTNPLEVLTYSREVREYPSRIEKVQCNPFFAGSARVGISLDACASAVHDCSILGTLYLNYEPLMLVRKPSPWTSLTSALSHLSSEFISSGYRYPLVTGLGFMGAKAMDVDRLALSLRKLTTPSSFARGEDNTMPGLLTGCVTTSSSSASAHWVQLFISSLTYESTLFLLTLVRAWSLNRRGAGTPIMTLMTRDGAWYFLVVIGMGQAYVTTTSADGYYSIRRFDSAGNLDSKDSNGSSPFTRPNTSIVHARLLRLRGFYTPADQSTRYEGTAQGQHNEISLQPYTPRKNDYLTTLATSATSFDRMSLKTPV